MASPSNVIDSSWSNIMKDLQDGTMVDQLAQHNDLWKYIQKNIKKDASDGKRLIRPLKTKRGVAGIKNISYNGSFASKRVATYVQLIAEAKYITAHIEVPYTIIQAGKKERGAFIRPMESEISDKQEGTAMQLSRQALGDGSGIIGTVASITDNGDDGDMVLSEADDKEGHVRWIEVNDELVIYVSAADDTAVTDMVASGTFSYFKVNSVVESTNTINVTPYNSSDAALAFDAGSFAANNVLVRADLTFNDNAAVTNHNDVCQEITGLEVIVDEDGKVHNIDRSTSPQYGSFVEKGANNLLSTDMFRSACTGAKKRGGKPKVAVMSDDVYNRFCDIAEEDKRLQNVNSAVLGMEVSGYKCSYGTVEFVLEYYCRDDRIFLIEGESIELYGDDFKFFEDPESGKVLRIASSSSGGYSPDFSAELFGTMELFGTKPAANARIEGFRI